MGNITNTERERLLTNAKREFVEMSMLARNFERACQLAKKEDDALRRIAEGIAENNNNKKGETS